MKPVEAPDHDFIISEFLNAVSVHEPHARSLQSPTVTPYTPTAGEAEVVSSSCGTASKRRRKKSKLAKASGMQSVSTEAPARVAGLVLSLGLAFGVFISMLWPHAPPTLAPTVQSACAPDEEVGDYPFAAAHALYHSSVVLFTASSWHRGHIDAIEQGLCSGQLLFRVQYLDGDFEHLSEDDAYAAAARAALALKDL